MPRVEYIAADGSKLVGCSDIARKVQLDAGKTDGLMRWAEKLITENKDRATESANAMGRGTIAHHMIDNYIWGDDPEADIPSSESLNITEHARSQQIIIAREAFDWFRYWWTELGMRPVVSELSMVCDMHRFGGTPDCVAMDVDGHTWIVDWKTGGKIQDEHFLQAAGYIYLWRTGRANQIQESPRAEKMTLPKDRDVAGIIIVKCRDGKPDVKRLSFMDDTADMLNYHMEMFGLGLEVQALMARKPKIRMRARKPDSDLMKAWVESMGRRAADFGTAVLDMAKEKAGSWLNG